MKSVQALTPIVIPLLSEKRLEELFLRLAMEMAMIVQGDEGKTQSEIHHEEQNGYTASQTT